MVADNWIGIMSKILKHMYILTEIKRELTIFGPLNVSAMHFECWLGYETERVICMLIHADSVIRELLWFGLVCDL